MITLGKHGHLIHTRKVTQQHSQTEPQHLIQKIFDTAAFTNRTTESDTENISDTQIFIKTSRKMKSIRASLSTSHSKKKITKHDHQWNSTDWIWHSTCSLLSNHHIPTKQGHRLNYHALKHRPGFGQSIILSSHPHLGVFQVVLSFTFPHQNPVWISLLPSIRHMALHISSLMSQNSCIWKSEWKYQQWSSSYLSHSMSRPLSGRTRTSVLKSYSKSVQ